MLLYTRRNYCNGDESLLRTVWTEIVTRRVDRSVVYQIVVQVPINNYQTSLQYNMGKGSKTTQARSLKSIYCSVQLQHRRPSHVRTQIESSRGRGKLQGFKFYYISQYRRTATKTLIQIRLLNVIKLSKHVEFHTVEFHIDSMS